VRKCLLLAKSKQINPPYDSQNCFQNPPFPPMVKLQVRHQAELTLAYFARDPALSDRERAGVWLGGASAPAGLMSGARVVPADLACALDGFGPAGQRLFTRRQPRRRCAWDCVVTVDKSVSVAALCALEFDRVQAAFCVAVMLLMHHLESLAYRRDNAGTGRALPTGNLLAALFVHDSSRHGDPHFHGHLLIINATRGTLGRDHDRRWRGLEPAPLYHQQSALRWVFNAELHRQFRLQGLRSSLEPRTGIATLPVPRPWCDRYSKAHQTIARMAAGLLASPDRLPDAWARLTGAELINRLNDRSRPAKRPPAQDWQSLFTDTEKAELTCRLVERTAAWSASGQPPLKPAGKAEGSALPWMPPPPARTIGGDPGEDEERARALLGEELARTSLFYSPHAIRAATCRTAARHLELPLGAFARAARWWGERRPRLKVFPGLQRGRLETDARRRLRAQAAATPVDADNAVTPQADNRATPAWCISSGLRVP
jgi:conjugative relaxase-like TrwC/TraI family protein